MFVYASYRPPFAIVQIHSTQEKSRTILKIISRGCPAVASSEDYDPGVVGQMMILWVILSGALGGLKI